MCEICEDDQYLLCSLCPQGERRNIGRTISDRDIYVIQLTKLGGPICKY